MFVIFKTRVPAEFAEQAKNVRNIGLIDHISCELPESCYDRIVELFVAGEKEPVRGSGYPAETVLYYHSMDKLLEQA